MASKWANNDLRCLTLGCWVGFSRKRLKLCSADLRLLKMFQCLLSIFHRNPASRTMPLKQRAGFWCVSLILWPCDSPFYFCSTLVGPCCMLWRYEKCVIPCSYRDCGFGLIHGRHVEVIFRSPVGLGVRLRERRSAGVRGVCCRCHRWAPRDGA